LGLTHHVKDDKISLFVVWACVDKTYISYCKKSISMKLILLRK